LDSAILIKIWQIFYVVALVIFFFGITIFVHEWGHFWVAKRRGMKIERFSIGFGPKIFSWTRDGVEYRVSWFPFGGYVSLPQMGPETLEGGSKEQPEPLPPAPPSSKILVAFAGPIMNLVFALALACVIWYFGVPRPVNPSVVGFLEPNSEEEQLGIRVGDRIVSVNNRPTETWMDIQRAAATARAERVPVVIERDGERREYTLALKVNEFIGVRVLNLYPQGRPFVRNVLPNSPAERAGFQAGDKFLSVDGVPVSTLQELVEFIGQKTGQPTEIRVLRGREVLTLVAVPEWDAKANAGRIGVTLGEEVEYVLQRPGPTPVEQFKHVLGWMGDTVYALIFGRETGVGARSLSGPVGIIGYLILQILDGGVRLAISFAILLNINLAIINLLPIPVLDGGHIIFATVEAIRRKPLNARFVQATSTAFATLLIAFMLYVTFFDVQRLWILRNWLKKPVPQQVEPVESTP
jgi:regulator of sigma E protease